MILRPRARPQILLQAVTRPSCLSPHLSQSGFSRSIHEVPVLSNGKDAIFKKYGVPGFLSKATYGETWTEYQKDLCKYLNDETAGGNFENLPVKRLHEVTSKDSSNAILYNHAAQAHHNHFFFNGLSAAPEPLPPADIIRGAIESWWESLDHLRDEIIDSAMGMFGSGYVWLMADGGNASQLRILCTYNTGSPFPDAHQRKQAFDSNTGTGTGPANRLIHPQNGAGSMGDKSRNSIKNYQNAFSGAPLLCVKVWEHQWMRDYGLAGKHAYLQNWWKRIDWEEAHARSNNLPQGGYGAMAPKSASLMGAVRGSFGRAI